MTSRDRLHLSRPPLPLPFTSSTRHPIEQPQPIVVEEWADEVAHDGNDILPRVNGPDRLHSAHAMASGSAEDDNPLKQRPICTETLAELAWVLQASTGTHRLVGQAAPAVPAAPSSEAVVASPAVISDPHRVRRGHLEAAAADSNPSLPASSHELMAKSTTTAVKAQDRMKMVAASSRKRLATRKDAPVVREPGRGSLAKALAAGEPQNRAKGLGELKKG